MDPGLQPADLHLHCFSKDNIFEFSMVRVNPSGIFLGLLWGRISVPSKSKNEQKLPKIVNYSLVKNS